MTSITIQVPGDVAERLGRRARAEGRASVEDFLSDLAEREGERDVDPEERRRMRDLIQQGYDSPHSPLAANFFAERKASLAERVARHESAAGE